MKDLCERVYEPGDNVWVQTTRKRTGSDKLDPLLMGPCEILDRIGNSGRYTVALPEGKDDVHMDDFKPYLIPPLMGRRSRVYILNRDRNCLKLTILSWIKFWTINLRKAYIYGKCAGKGMVQKRILGNQQPVLLDIYNKTGSCGTNNIKFKYHYRICDITQTCNDPDM